MPRMRSRLLTQSKTSHSRVRKQFRTAGVAGDCHECPAALDLQARKGIIDAWVAKGVAFIERNDAIYRYVLPKEVSEMIETFDNTHYFGPNTITFKAPKIGERLGDRKGKKHQGKKKGSGSGKGSNLGMAANKKRAKSTRFFKGFGK